MRQKSKPLDGDRGRATNISDIEEAIASRWYLKDHDMEIAGLTKQFLGEYAGFNVYKVDMDWIKNNLDTTFGTGGHGLVHTFIPLDEIWVDDVSEPWPEIALHEAVEFHYMFEKNEDYWPAHQKAIQAENAQPISEDNLSDLITSYSPERRNTRPAGR